VQLKQTSPSEGPQASVEHQLHRGCVRPASSVHTPFTASTRLSNLCGSQDYHKFCLCYDRCPVSLRLQAVYVPLK